MPVVLAGMLAACLFVLTPAAVASTPPAVTSATVTPSSLPSTGGDVTVDAQVSEGEGAPVDFVVVRVTGPYWYETALVRGPGTDEWTGDVAIPYNLATDPVTWQLTVVARNLDGEEGSAGAGSVQVAPGVGFDEAPVAFDPVVAPRALSSAGGPVALAVSATDATGVADVHAEVTDAAGAVTRVPLESVGGDRYEGVFVAPPAPGTATVRYAVRMAAVDAIGQVGDVDAGVLTVAGRPSGRLVLDRSARDLGTVQIGGHALRPLVLRNDGARGTEPVTGAITTSGAPFSLAGPSPMRLPFSLRPGQRLTVLVEFRPTTAGRASGTLLVSRPDGVQPPLAVSLSGTGVVRSARR